jgi:hypothetical protein
MKVTLDGATLEVGDQTLSGALSSALEAAGDRLIIDAVADGERVSPEDLTTPPDRSPYAGEIEFTSADPIALMKVTVGEAVDSIDQIEQWQREAGEQMQAGDLERALPIIASVLGGWGALRTTVELVVQGGLMPPSLAEESLNSLVGDLAELLGELKASIERQDWSSVSDTLAYDLDDRADAWRDWLLNAADSLEKVG